MLPSPKTLRTTEGCTGRRAYSGKSCTSRPRRGLRGTGIGCFFDDAVHEVARVTDTEFQSLYHFVVGKAVADPHLESAPPYPDRNLRLTRER